MVGPTTIGGGEPSPAPYRGWGGFPPNLRWGTAHASVPPIFGEVVLSQVGLGTEKNGILCVK